jgi:hypothetical protein
MFTQDYSWPSEKAAIATIASLAEPLYACPAAPVDAPVVCAENNAVPFLERGSGVTRYVVERAPTVRGPFTGSRRSPEPRTRTPRSSNGSSWAYRIRTCPSQVSAP